MCSAYLLRQRELLMIDRRFFGKAWNAFKGVFYFWAVVVILYFLTRSF